MLQFAVWTGLREMGVGANLQHYNPVIDDAVRALTGVPESYQLVAQMVYGGIVEDAGEKPGEDISDRVTVIE
jgi:predicted oxidoreductase (fatty acid repression mutant protein)